MRHKSTTHQTEHVQWPNYTSALLLLACFFRIIPSHAPSYLDALGPYFWTSIFFRLFNLALHYLLSFEKKCLERGQRLVNSGELAPFSSCGGARQRPLCCPLDVAAALSRPLSISGSFFKNLNFKSTQSMKKFLFLFSIF